MKNIKITDEAYGKLVVFEKSMGFDHSRAILFLIDFYKRNR